MAEGDDELIPWTAEWLREYARQDRKGSLYDIQGGLCPWCGLSMTRREATREHIIPLSRGGTSDIANLALAHGKCNHARRSNTNLRPVDKPEFYFIRARLDAHFPEKKKTQPPELKVGEFWYGNKADGEADKP